MKQGADTVAAYSYNGDGLRIQKVAGAVTTRYYYDGDRILNEGNGTAITASNIWGLRPIRRDSAGQTGYYLYDGHPDVVGMVDPAGSVLATYGYDEFGQAVKSTGTSDNPFRYTAEPYDTETGAVYLRSRYYRPDLGRFLTQDTWKGSPWAPWTQNLYAYVGNNPVNMVDPTGHVALRTDEESCDCGSPPAIDYGPAQKLCEGMEEDLFWGPSCAGAALQHAGFVAWADEEGTVSLHPINFKNSTALSPAKLAALAALMGGTYALVDKVTGEVVRTGRSNDLGRREAEHFRDPLTGAYTFRAVSRTDNYAEQRGLEQELYNRYPNARLNRVRPISPRNPRLQQYLDAARGFLDRKDQE